VRINILSKIAFILLSFMVVMSSQSSSAESKPAYNQLYDPARDPSADLLLATEAAKKSNKYVLLIVGGEWCTWCKTLGAHLDKEKELAANLKSTFEIMKVNYSKENKNEEFLNKYPKTKGYPHFFIVNSDAEFISSIDTLPFKKDKAYINQPFEKLITHFADKANKGKVSVKSIGE